MTEDKLPLSLYIHYPYCIRKCPYCDFNSYRKDSMADDDIYLKALIEDFDKSSELILGRKINTVYIGGGTPSLFGVGRIEKLLLKISPYLSSDAEISMEANPGTVSLESLQGFYNAGINRISIGVQSFNDEQLKSLGRIHDGKTAIECCKNVIKAGFCNFNVDIMHGLPGQDVKKAMNDLSTAFDTGANHLSWYELTLEEDTHFGKHPPKLPTEDTLLEIEESGFDLLCRNGFNRYEVSGYTKDKKCRHNLNYWYFGDYLGIGAGAHGKIRRGSDTLRRANAQRVEDYLNDVFSIGSDRMKYHEVAKEELPFEFMLNRLRVFEPVKFDEFSKTTALPFSLVEEKLRISAEKGLLIIQDDHFSLTDLGKLMLNDILQMFL